MKISIGRNGKFEYREMGNWAVDRGGGNGGKAFTEKRTNQIKVGRRESSRSKER